MAETIEVRNMRLVNPTGTSLSSSDFRLNERPDSLSGKTLGFAFEVAALKRSQTLRDWEFSTTLYA